MGLTLFICNKLLPIIGPSKEVLEIKGQNSFIAQFVVYSNSHQKFITDREIGIEMMNEDPEDHELFQTDENSPRQNLYSFPNLTQTQFRIQSIDKTVKLNVLIVDDQYVCLMGL